MMIQSYIKCIALLNVILGKHDPADVEETMTKRMYKIYGVESALKCLVIQRTSRRALSNHITAICNSHKKKNPNTIRFTIELYFKGNNKEYKL